MEKYALSNGDEIIWMGDDNDLAKKLMDGLVEKKDAAVLIEVDEFDRTKDYEAPVFNRIKNQLNELSLWKLYPIYRVEWTFEKIKNGKSEKDLYSYSKDIMYPERQTSDTWKQLIEDWEFTQGVRYDCDINTLGYKVTLVEFNDWNLEWFCHYTFDKGQTDKDAYISFLKFVERYRHQQGHDSDFIIESKKTPGLIDGYHCLMGAEDTQRIGHYPKVEGEGKIDKSKEFEYGTPCRCARCKEAGLLRFEH